ncbi:MAG: hypothetical protein ABI647_15670 [Gemmatimonadota bacterium]
MALADDSSRIILHTGRSSRLLLSLAFGAGAALLASAFLATDALPDRIFRGIVGTAASAFFGGSLAWAVSHRVIATPAALVSRSITGSVELPWRDIDGAAYHDITEKRVLPLTGARASAAERPGPVGHYLLVESAARGLAIKIRNDLEPAAAREQVVERIERRINPSESQR